MPAKALSKSKPNAERRSPCPVACSLDIFGDRWTLLVVRDLVCGKSRFKDFSASPEGIPTNILADRLERLLRHDVVRRIPAARDSRHFAYELTAKGQALKPLLGFIRDWGLKWEKNTKALLSEFPRKN